jgi:hypothetical protein
MCLLRAAAFVPRCPAAIGRFMAPSQLGDFPRERRDRAANRWHGSGSLSVRTISRPSARQSERTTGGWKITFLQLLDAVGMRSTV